jgi:hypothetical protein
LLESLCLQPELLFQLLLEPTAFATFSPPELLFQLHQFLSEPLSESPSTIAAVTKDKILSIDLEASSFDGITNSTSRGSELVSTIAKLECLIFELLLLRCVQL